MLPHWKKGVEPKIVCTVKSREVDWSTIQFWTLLAKGHSTEPSNFPFIRSLKIVGCATNREMLLLAILRYVLNCMYIFRLNTLVSFNKSLGYYIQGNQTQIDAFQTKFFSWLNGILKPNYFKKQCSSSSFLLT